MNSNSTPFQWGFPGKAMVLLWLCLISGPLFARGFDEGSGPELVQRFVAKHCYDCHQGESAAAGLDLVSLSRDLTDDQAFARWVRVLDRVQDGEMPPPDAWVPEAAETEKFLDVVGRWLRAHQQQQFAEAGRVRGRRLTNRQVERTLHDLLGVDIPLAESLPEEPRPDQFATVADGQAMSRFQLEAHLAVVDEALDEAFRRALQPDDRWERMLDAKTLSRTRPHRIGHHPGLGRFPSHVGQDG